MPDFKRQSSKDNFHKAFLVLTESNFCDCFCNTNDHEGVVDQKNHLKFFPILAINLNPASTDQK